MWALIFYNPAVVDAAGLSLNLAAAGWLLTLCMKFKPYKRQHKLLPDENAFGSVWGDRLEFVQKVTTSYFLLNMIWRRWKIEKKEKEGTFDKTDRESNVNFIIEITLLGLWTKVITTFFTKSPLYLHESNQNRNICFDWIIHRCLYLEI